MMTIKVTINFLLAGTSKLSKMFFRMNATFDPPPYSKKSQVIRVIFTEQSITQMMYVAIEYPYMQTICDVFELSPRQPKSMPIPTESARPIR
jgi:hypothetical protein